MADKVTKSNFLSESHNNVVELLKNNVSNPAGLKKWVYSRRPDIKSLSFKGFPFVVVYPTTLSFPKRMSLNGQKKSVSFGIEIEIISQDSINTKGKGLYYLDALSDSIIEQLNGESNRQTLRQNGLFFSNPEVSSVSVEDWHNSLIYTRTILLTLKNVTGVF